MIRTKQTAHGSKLARPAGMQAAMLGDRPEAEQDIAEEDWPDLGDPQLQAAKQAIEKGEASKSAGKEGDQPTQAEGGGPAPPEENPPAPMTLSQVLALKIHRNPPITLRTPRILKQFMTQV